MKTIETRPWRAAGPVNIPKLNQAVADYRAGKIEGSEIFLELDPLIQKWARLYHRGWADRIFDLDDTIAICYAGIFDLIRSDAVGETITIPLFQKACWASVSTAIRTARRKVRSKRHIPPDPDRERRAPRRDREFWKTIKGFVDTLDPVDRVIWFARQEDHGDYKMDHYHALKISRQAYHKRIDKIRDRFARWLRQNLSVCPPEVRTMLSAIEAAQ